MMTRKYEELRSKIRERPGATERITARVAELEREASLAEIRKALELTQQQLAASLGLTQPGISRIENEADLFVSTLRGYVEALGGELEISAVFEDLKIPIKSFTSFAEETSLVAEVDVALVSASSRLRDRPSNQRKDS